MKKYARIIKFLIKKQWTEAEIAISCDSSQPTINRIKNGKAKTIKGVTAEKLERIYKAWKK